MYFMVLDQDKKIKILTEDYVTAEKFSLKRTQL